MVEMMCNGDTLDDDFSLLDISYIYSRKRTEPLRLCYRICQTVSPKRLKTNQHETTSTATSSSVVAITIESSAKNISDSKQETKLDVQVEANKNTEKTSETDKPSAENSAKDDGQVEKKEKETEKPKQNHQSLERKRSAGKLTATKVNNEKKNGKKRTRSDEVGATKKRAAPDAASLAALGLSAPRENGTRDVLSLKEEVAKKIDVASSQINGSASSSDVMDARKTSVDKENKQTEEKRDELSNGNTDNKGLTIGEKVNGLVNDEKKLELVAGKT